jgi:DNA repair exonuclease SbcCD ATPase subunit
MKLIELNIRNFKGVRSFDLCPGGESISIHGDNASGKTTVYDAFLWLLFGKDSTANRL